MMNVCIDEVEEVTELYGVLMEFLQLDYRIKSVFLFRCDWFDLAGAKKGMKMKSDGFLRGVNVSSFLYKEAPFMLASQANTCIYLVDTKYGDP